MNSNEEYRGLTPTGGHHMGPAPKVINVADARLNRCLLHQAERYASVSEYAEQTGIDTATIIDLMGPHLDSGTLALEVEGDELFVHTAPHGRPAPRGSVDVRPNLWERLRERAPKDIAYGLWQLTRGLERSGWIVETSAAMIASRLGPVSRPPALAVEVGAALVPILAYPTLDDLISPTGILTEYHRAGALAVAIVCEQGALDDNVTAVRRWVLSHPVRPQLHALILEAPRFNPTHLRPNDAAVTAHAVTRHTLTSMEWSLTQ